MRYTNLQLRAEIGLAPEMGSHWYELEALNGTKIMLGSGFLPQLYIGLTPRDSDLIELLGGLDIHIFKSSLEGFLIQLKWKNHCSREKVQL